jgi:hypothetical protein
MQASAIAGPLHPPPLAVFPVLRAPREASAERGRGPLTVVPLLAARWIATLPP